MDVFNSETIASVCGTTPSNIWTRVKLSNTVRSSVGRQRRRSRSGGLCFWLGAAPCWMYCLIHVIGMPFETDVFINVRKREHEWASRPTENYPSRKRHRVKILLFYSIFSLVIFSYACVSYVPALRSNNQPLWQSCSPMCMAWKKNELLSNYFWT